MIFTILEEIKGQGRQNTLMLQALLKRQPHVEQEHGSLRLDEFRFPLDTKEDIDRVERMLMDQATEKALVCDRCTIVNKVLFFSDYNNQYIVINSFWKKKMQSDAKSFCPYWIISSAFSQIFI